MSVKVTSMPWIGSSPTRTGVTVRSSQRTSPVWPRHSMSFTLTVRCSTSARSRTDRSSTGR